MSRSVFVHETIDIVGQGQYDYMEMVNREPAQHMPDMTSLQGTFYVLGFGGGRWPQVINIWDCGEDGWDGWGRNLDRLNLKRRKAFYGDWWDEAAQWRTGGFDRVCAGVPESLTTRQIEERGIKGTLFLNEVLSVQPGTQIEYLNLVVIFDIGSDFCWITWETNIFPGLTICNLCKQLKHVRDLFSSDNFSHG